MSRGFIKEGDQEEVPVVPPRAHLPKGVPNHVTREGLQALLDERKMLENQRAGAGDNYIMSNFIDAKMKLLNDRINSAVEVDLSKASRETVSFGAWVRYNDRTVRIVGVDEADFSKGLLSFISPIAKSLIGRRVGDVFEIVIPKGKERIVIHEISLEPLELTHAGPARSGNAGAPRNAESAGEKNVGTKNTTSQSPSSPQPIPEVTSEPADSVSIAPTEAAGRNEPVFVPEERLMDFLPLVNERGNIVGRALYADLHKGNKLLHPVIHLHADNGAVSEKYWWHVVFGETPEATLRRKLQETLGLADTRPKLKRQYLRETRLEKELVYVFRMTTDSALLKTPQNAEYQDVFAKD